MDTLLINKRNAYVIGSIFLFLLSLAATFFFVPTIRLRSVPLSFNEEAAHTYDTCKDGTRDQSMNKETCYSKAMQDVATRRGPEDAFGILFALQKKDVDAIGCHFISHGIGYGTYERDPSHWQKDIQTINRSCTYGAVHGIIEKYTATLRRGLTKDVIPTICGSNPIADCNHIMGHLLLVETRGNVNNALDLCNVFDEKRQKAFCVSGVFMEQITALNLINHGYVPKSWLNWAARVDDLEKLCRAQDGERAVGCWEEIVHAVIVKFNDNPAKVFAFCDKSPLLEAASACKYHGIGIMATNTNFDQTRMHNICTVPQPNDSQFESNCYPRLVSSILSTSFNKTADAIQFCTSAPAQFQHSCFSQIGYNLNLATQFSADTVRNFCLRAPKEYRLACEGTHAAALSSPVPPSSQD